MYNNQYLISTTRLDVDYNINTIQFNNFYVYIHQHSICTVSTFDSIEILLLGYIIDPTNPRKSNFDIINHIAKTCQTLESLFKELQGYSGRYVLIYENRYNLIALNDACALKHLYYGTMNDSTIVMTSSIKMFLDFFSLEIELSKNKKDFVNSKEFKALEAMWVGNKSADNRLNKVLPNHYYDIKNNAISRIPIFHDDKLDEEGTINFASVILQGGIEAIQYRYNPIQPITAGLDSRILLAASKNFKDNLQYYVFDYSKTKTKIPDLLIPQKLNSKLDLNLKIITPEILNENFQTEHRKENILPFLLQKHSEIQYHYYNHSNQNVIRISGLCAEIVRNFYGYTNHKDVVNLLIYFTGYNLLEFASREITDWYREARDYSEEFNIPLLDLFYWEQRLGNWAASFMFEQDIAIEEFCPFSNKNLLLSIFNINQRERTSPNYRFFFKLAKSMWPETLCEPVNPAGLFKYLSGFPKRSALLRYYKLRAKSACFD